MLRAYKSPPIPTPPSTIKAPVPWSVAEFELVIRIGFELVLPRATTVCSVLIFQMSTMILKRRILNLKGINVMTLTLNLMIEPMIGL